MNPTTSENASIVTLDFFQGPNISGGNLRPATANGLHDLFTKALGIEGGSYNPNHSIQQNYDLLDVDSMKRLEILAEIEHHCWAVIPENDYLQFTLEELAGYINTHRRNNDIT